MFGMLEDLRLSRKAESWPKRDTVKLHFVSFLYSENQGRNKIICYRGWGKKCGLLAKIFTDADMP